MPLAEELAAVFIPSIRSSGRETGRVRGSYVRFPHGPQSRPESTPPPALCA